jgi:long-chain acyl-CoA synthetase
VRGISSGAAPLPVTLIEKLRKLFPDAPIGEGYGLTEVTMMATGNPSFRSGTRKPGTVGVPIFDTEISIQPLGGGTPLPPGERGEVCIRGPQVMRGYAHRPEATAESIDPDGWFHTGDVGILDEDGYLSIVDRTKDMLLYKGYNVFPRELEEKLFAVPGVAGAAVVGRPDEEAGELPVAYVVRKADEAGEALTRDALLDQINSQVVHYKRLRDVVFIEAIPVSAAGKVLKRELAARERAETGAA